MDAWVLITGATGGFGKALSAACAARGWGLCLTDLDNGALDALATGLRREFAVPVRTFACDLTLPDQRSALWSWLAAEGLTIWMLLHVAGIDYQGPFAQRSLDKLLTIVRLHVEATIDLCHHALAQRAHGRVLRLVNIASFAAFFAMPGKAVYAASKSFIVDFSRALGAELRDHNASVTVVCPAGMATAPRTIRGLGALGVWGKLTSSDLNGTARRTLGAALRGRPEFVPGMLNHAIRAIAALTPLPWRLRWIARHWGRQLDQPAAR